MCLGNPVIDIPEILKQLDDYSLLLISELAVKAPPQQMKNTRATDALTTRLMKVTWYMPFMIRLQISYPSGLEHIIINCPTPINNEQIKVVQFCYRNNSNTEATIEEIIKFERLILNEARSILETTPPNVSLDPQYENHIPTDRSGLLMRKMFLKYLTNMPAKYALKEEMIISETQQSTSQTAPL